METASMDELPSLTPSSKIFVAGHRGLAGSAIVRQLEKSGYLNLILTSRAELDLRDQAAVSRFFARHLPEFVFLSAAEMIPRAIRLRNWPGLDLHSQACAKGLQ